MKKVTVKDLSLAARLFRDLREEVEKTTSIINPVEMVTPLDFQKIKAEWIKKAENGSFTNPTFQYNKAYLNNVVQTEQHLEALLKKLKNTDVNNPAEVFYLDYLEEVVVDAILSVDMARAMLAQDRYSLTRIVLEKYGEADAGLIQCAKNLAYFGFVKKTGIELDDNLQKLSVAKFDADLIAKLFTWTMEQYKRVYRQVNIWPVEVLDCSAIDVRDKSSYGYPLIAIPKTKEVNGIKLAELIGHEIECHWRHSQNACLLGLPKLDDETLYEGVAKMKDYRFNEQYSEEASAPVPFYVLAQQFARAGASFAETAFCLTEKYNLAPGKSWIYAYRTFRGTSGLDNPSGYAFTKDRAYLEGFLCVKQINANPEHKAFLNFGTLSKRQLEKLSGILNYKEVEENTLPDLNLQKESVKRILNCI